MGTECPECGDEYDLLGQHWRYSPSHRPELTQHQKEVITGLLMGDGYINRPEKRRPSIECQMVSPNYLEYLDNIFGCLSTGVRLRKTAEEAAKESRKSGHRPNAKEENYSDVYRWRSRNHPELQRFDDWYSSGEKVWPENVELTPTVLKHWYCGDGCWQTSGTQNRIIISMNNEVKNTEKVDRYFERVGLPLPSNYSIDDRGKYINCEAQWTVEGSKELWDYMGEPLPDFKYKWPEQYH